MPGKYAANTTVSIGRTRDEIERTLERFGADQFIWGRDDRQGSVTVAFSKGQRSYRFTIYQPDAAEFKKTPTGRVRYSGTVGDLVDKEQRRRFRSLANFIKATLDAVESGIITADEALLPWAMLPGGRTVSEVALSQLSENGHVDLRLALPKGEQA